MLEFFEASLGETLALLTAFTWAVAVILFKKSGESVHPISLNLFKNLLSVVMLIPTVWLMGDYLLMNAPAGSYLLLLLSGALGIGIGDTLFFKSLNTLGAGLSAIVVCLYSPVIIALSMIFLGESLSLWQLVGATMIISAVLTAGMEKRPGDIDRRRLVVGIAYGLAAQLVNGVGLVIVKPLLNDSPVVWVTFWRLVGGATVLAVVLAVWPRRKAVIDSLLNTREWHYVIAGSVTGAYLAMMLWLGGMKYTQASTAAALNQTSNILVFIMAAVLLKERVTLPRVIGILVAVAGAILVTIL